MQYKQVIQLNKEILMKYLFLLIAIFNTINSYSQDTHTSCTIYTVNGKYDTTNIAQYSNNKQGLVAQETKYYNKTKRSDTKYTFSEDGLSCYGLTTSQNGDSTWHWQSYNNNKLTTLRTTNYKADRQKWGDTLIHSYTYNDAGHIAEELIWYKKNVFGEIILNTWNTNRITYTYNNLGKLLSKKEYYIYSLNDWDKELLKNKADRLEDTIKLKSTTYNYKPKGYTRINYDINNIDLYDTAYVMYEFDKFNRVVKETERTKSVLSESIIRTYSYHPEKRQDREIYYNAADKLQRVKIFVYE